VSAVRRNSKRKKAATLDELPLLGARQMAKLFGVSEATFSGWVADGIIERRGLDGYDLLEVIPRIYKDLRLRSQGRGEFADQKALTAARTEEMRARARLIQGRVNERENEHWHIEKVAHFIANIFYVVIESFAGVGARYCHRLGISNHEQCCAIMEEFEASVNDTRELIHEKLGELGFEISQATTEGRLVGLIAKPKPFRGNTGRLRDAEIDELLDNKLGIWKG
jgi:hypothetical protein